MRTIIAGSRSLENHPELQSLVENSIRESNIKITEVVSGGCYGVDTAGEKFASKNNIPIVFFLPDWESKGRAAGPLRNKEMAEYAQALILIWDGKSKGSYSMLKEARLKNLKIYERIVRSL